MNMTLTPLRKAKGVVLVLTALSLIVLMGMAGLAIDLSHADVNKTRLQNLADALALSAAISLNKQNNLANSTDEVAAEDYAKANTFLLFKNSSGNSEINTTIASSDLNFTFAKISNLNASTTGDWKLATAINDANFVRVTVGPMKIPTWFAKVIGFNQMTPSTSAVAGTAPIAPCDLAPILMCSDLTPLDDVCDVNDDDGFDDSDHIGECYGYKFDNLYCLSVAENSNPTKNICLASNNPPTYGPGNVGLLNFDKMFPDAKVKGGGGKVVEKCLAGDTNCRKLCLSDESPGNAITKPGVTWGNVNDGIGSLFNKDNPDLGYPSDKITGYGTLTTTPFTSTSNTLMTYANITSAKGDPNYKIPVTGIPYSDLGYNPYTNYNSYLGKQDTNASTDAVLKKRVLAVPFVDCTTFAGNGGVDKALPIVGYGCFFIAAPAEKNTSEILLLGSFLGDDACQATGDLTAIDDFGVDKVILYKDPLGGHS